jgi:ketosteroid isomerase-like protein
VSHQDVLHAEDTFFSALLAGDATALDGVLAEDFALVDVIAGAVLPRQALVGLIASGELTFLEIVRNPADTSVRQRTGVGVVVGRTRMTISGPEGQVTVHSRYTHVYVNDAGQWRLLAAQGTQEAGQGPDAG